MGSPKVDLRPARIQPHQTYQQTLMQQLERSWKPLAIQVHSGVSAKVTLERLLPAFAFNLSSLESSARSAMVDGTNTTHTIEISTFPPTITKNGERTTTVTVTRNILPFRVKGGGKLAIDRIETKDSHIEQRHHPDMGEGNKSCEITSSQYHYKLFYVPSSASPHEEVEILNLDDHTVNLHENVFRLSVGRTVILFGNSKILQAIASINMNAKKIQVTSWKNPTLIDGISLDNSFFANLEMGQNVGQGLPSTFSTFIATDTNSTAGISREVTINHTTYTLFLQACGRHLRKDNEREIPDLRENIVLSVFQKGIENPIASLIQDDPYNVYLLSLGNISFRLSCGLCA